MNDETAAGSARAPGDRGHLTGSSAQPAPLQSRAEFLRNWSRVSVTEINAGLCQRARAQRGLDSETHAATQEEWQKRQASELTLLETFQFLKSCHRGAPFLFFNGRGATEGIVLCLLDDGRVVWRPDSTKVELLAIPESLFKTK